MRVERDDGEPHGRPLLDEVVEELGRLDPLGDGGHRQVLGGEEGPAVLPAADVGQGQDRRPCRRPGRRRRCSSPSTNMCWTTSSRRDARQPRPLDPVPGVLAERPAGPAVDGQVVVPVGADHPAEVGRDHGPVLVSDAEQARRRPRCRVRAPPARGARRCIGPASCRSGRPPAPCPPGVSPCRCGAPGSAMAAAGPLAVAGTGLAGPPGPAGPTRELTLAAGPPARRRRRRGAAGVPRPATAVARAPVRRAADPAGGGRGRCLGQPPHLGEPADGGERRERPASPTARAPGTMPRGSRCPAGSSARPAPSVRPWR